VLAEELDALVVGQVHLAEQHRVAAPPGQEGAELTQQRVRVLAVRLDAVDLLEEERHRVDPEAGHAEREPERADLRDLVADRRVRGVEVRLLGVEAVEVPALRLLVPRPVRRLLAGEDQLLLVVRLLVLPHVVVVEGRVAALARRLEPGVAVRGVVHDEVDDHPDAAVLRRAQHLGEVAEVAELLVDGVEVADVVAVVAFRRRVAGHQPQARDAEAGEVVDPVGEPDEVAAAVAVGVEEGLDVEAVDHRVLPPEVAGGRALAGHDRTSGSTCSPKQSRNARCSCPTWWM
jgi:hypothetical protein